MLDEKSLVEKYSSMNRHLKRYFDGLFANSPVTSAQGLLLDHIALVGAAPFERRSLPIAAALQEAEQLAALTDRMEPLPGLEVEQAPIAG